jgi:phosphoglucosamine mutase
MSPLFGTDGVRGTAGEYPLDRDTVTRLGGALVRALAPDGRAPRLLMGRDTRESSSWIERALARGAGAQGARLTSAGVIPTPAVSYLTTTLGFDAGLVISASHNPFEDNGVKVFSTAGEKLPDEVEQAIEAMVADRSWPTPELAEVDLAEADLSDRYLAHLRASLPHPGRLGCLRVAIDTANGATSGVAPRLFTDLGFDVTVLYDRPDGRNINVGCGSTHPAALAAAVASGGHRLGIAFDGDGDRAIFIDHEGRVVDGDAVLFLCARQLKAEGRLPNDVVVATVMSNIGLELALRDHGIRLARCPVGDKYVREEMVSQGAAIGGEQSGHIIFSDYLSTGDGLLTALQVLRAMAETGRELADLARALVAYPQVLVNVRVREKRAVEEIPAVRDVMERVARRLEGRGRLLIRYSGTEPLLRIMIEGPDQQAIQTLADEIAERVRQSLG